MRGFSKSFTINLIAVVAATAAMASRQAVSQYSHHCHKHPAPLKSKYFPKGTLFLVKYFLFFVITTLYMDLLFKQFIFLSEFLGFIFFLFTFLSRCLWCVSMSLWLNLWMNLKIAVQWKFISFVVFLEPFIDVAVVVVA